MIPVGLAILGSGARGPTVAFLLGSGLVRLASIVFAVILSRRLTWRTSRFPYTH